MENNAILNKEQLLHRLQSFSHSDFIVAFYINRTVVSQDEWMNTFAGCLNDAGFITVGIIATENEGQCALTAPMMKASISRDDIKLLERINVFIIVDLDFTTDFPQTSKVLASPHGLITAGNDSTPQGMCYQLHNLPHVDGWMPSFPINSAWKESVKKFWTGFVSPVICKRQNHDFFFIPFGYPRLATLTKELEECSAPLDSIIYAPTKNASSPGADGNRLAAYAIPAIEHILASASSHNVIFRPYKDDQESDEVKNICAAFAGEKRFSLDTESGRLPSFSRSAALVTDLSHIGRSFSFSTLRPSIFFKPWSRNAEKSIEERSGCLYAYNGEGLREAVRLAISGDKEFGNRIAAARLEQVIPSQEVFHKLPQMLKDFYANATHEDWLVIERDGNVHCKSDVELVREIMTFSPGARPVAAAAALVWNNPHSALLAAFALDCGARYSPQKHIYYQADKPASALLSHDISKFRYGDIPDACIAKLYAHAFREQQAKGNMEGAAFAQELMRKRGHMG